MNRGWRVWQVGAGMVAIALCAAISAPTMRADETGHAGARAVRLGSVEGHVQVSQGDQMIADPALGNMPVFEGTNVVTLDDGRAEIQFEDGSLARISPNSSLRLSVLRGQGGSAETEIVAEGGLGYFELQGGSGGPMRIRFGDSLVTATGFTVLRINLDNPPGELAVFSGNAHLERGSAVVLDLHGGESVALSGADPSRYNLSESIEPDSWDTWNADRDQALQAEYGAQTGATKSFPDSNNPAWADLDANGNWYNVPGQGNVWSPTEASSPEWDPYGDGYWMWTPRFGYMWVSGNAWGYLPYQCGAWNYFDAFGWGWEPGMCHPWWSVGGWIANIGLAPGGYRFPRRPGPHPVRPGPHPVLQGRQNGQPATSKAKLGAYPVIPVSRRLSGITGTLPARTRNVPVVIAGHAVQPMAPGSQRPVYGKSNPVFANRAQPTYANRVGQPAGLGGSSHPGSPQAPRTSGSGQHPAPAGHSSSGGGSSSHSTMSSGGGGGGGSHGGGGGGGGGSHR